MPQDCASAWRSTRSPAISNGAPARALWPGPTAIPTMSVNGMSAPSNPSPGDELAEPGLWRRFHIRLTVLYGGLTLLSIALLGISTYRLLNRFRTIVRRNPDIASIDLLKSTQIPTRLRFVVDVVRQGASGQPGEIDDASDVPLMLKGFNE